MIRRSLIGSLALALSATAALTLRAGDGTADPATPTLDSRARNGEWIAYPTARYGTQFVTGSDVFIARVGGKPILVASKGAAGRIWNACPTFSPDGTKLAFGTKTPGRRYVSVVRVTRAGVSAAQRVRLSVPGDDPCPLWSADGSRLAHISRKEVVVRGLDGSWLRPTAGDPTDLDFAARHDDRVPLVSPAGDLVARLRFVPHGGCSVVVERADGSGRRIVPVVRREPSRCPYSLAAWSPDGRRLLLTYEVTGQGFTMVAVAVGAPFEKVRVVERVRVDHERSRPDRGDVSWQPHPS